MQPWSKTLFQPFFCSWGCIYIWTPYLIQHMVKWNKFWLQTYYFMIIILSSEYYGRERHTHTILKGLRVFKNIQSFYLKHLFNMTLTLNKCLKVRHILIYNRLQIRAMDMNIVFRKSWPPKLYEVRKFDPTGTVSRLLTSTNEKLISTSDFTNPPHPKTPSDFTLSINGRKKARMWINL